MTHREILEGPETPEVSLGTASVQSDEETAAIMSNINALGELFDDPGLNDILEQRLDERD